jgi:hypothetical protein
MILNIFKRLDTINLDVVSKIKNFIKSVLKNIRHILNAKMNLIRKHYNYIYRILKLANILN